MTVRAQIASPADRHCESALEPGAIGTGGKSLDICESVDPLAHIAHQAHMLEAFPKLAL
jgi:hypothetical protein